MIIEVQTFRLKPGADIEAFISADHRVQTEFIPNHPGLLRRTTARDGDDWVAVVLWYSSENADASLALWESDPVMHVFTSFLAPGSLAIKRYEDLGG